MDLVTFTKEILNEKLRFLYSELSKLIELKLISTTFTHQTLANLLLQNEVAQWEISTLTELQTVHEFSSLFIIKLLLNVNLHWKRV